MVRCADCGLLALRHSATRQLEEAEWSYRQSGEMPTRLTGSEHFPFTTIHDRSPICFVRAVDLHGEIKEGDDWHAPVMRERDCSKFTPWQQGYSPKHHSEMSFIQELARQTREQARQQREEDLRWQRQVEALAETRHQEERRDARRLAWLAMTGSIVTAVVSVALSGLLAWWLARP